jgi:hypothetical protein
MDFTGYLNSIAEWFNSGIYNFATEAVAYLMTQLFILWLKSQLFMLEFAWGVAKSILQGLNVSSLLSSAWGMLPAEVAKAAAFFRIPDAVNLLLTAGTARFVLGFLPF